MRIENLEDDLTWLRGLSYRDLMEHFRNGKLTNKFHNGAMGKLFSDTMNARRATLDAQTVARIDQEVAKSSAREVERVLH